MSTTARIRPYRDADAEGVRECLALLQDVERAIEPRLRPGHEVAEATMLHMLERCRIWDGCLSVAEVDGRVVGFINVYRHVPLEGPEFTPGDGYAIVSDLAVLEPYRCRGIGTALLKWAEDFTRAAGVGELRIGVLKENPALKLYADVGFEPYYEILIKKIDSR